jgi:hypothetical protein
MPEANMEIVRKTKEILRAENSIFRFLIVRFIAKNSKINIQNIVDLVLDTTPRSCIVPPITNIHNSKNFSNIIFIFYYYRKSKSQLILDF